MVYIKLVNESYKNADAVNNLYKYIINVSKTGGMVGGCNVIPEYAVEMMQTVKRLYSNEDGKQLLHIILSFQTGVPITEEAMFEISSCIASYFCKHQVVYSVHSDTDNMHAHFMVNTISFADGSRLTDNVKIRHDLQEMCKRIIYPQN